MGATAGKRVLGRAVLLLGIAVAFAIAFAFDLPRHLTLEAVQGGQAQLAGLLERDPVPLVLGFFLFYIVMTSLSIPGGIVLSLAAGAVFGLVGGTVLVSFASTIGASLAFLASRYLLRDWVARRFGPRIERIDRGIARDGVFYLLALRLNPVVPYFLINLGMGLTRMKLPAFAFTSQLGMLPATLVYVNAGTQVARIERVEDILSPPLLGSLLLLSLFPLIGKFAADRLRRRRLYRGFEKPKRFDRNLIVIGAGAGGLVASYIAAAARAKVTLIEEQRMGGDCLNTGCVPSKALIRAARLAHEMRHAGRFGLAAREPEPDFTQVMERVRAAIRAIEPHDSAERFSGLGVDVRAGRARILDPWTVEVGGERLTSRAILLATGAEPVVPDLPGLREAGCLTSETLWDGLAALPGRLVILGGGPIGCELGQAFARLGSRVTIVEPAPRILGKEDPDAAALIAALLRAEGIELLTGAEPLRCEGKALVVRDRHDRESALPFDAILAAVGRRARLAGYGLEELGIDTGRPLELNACLETVFPNIYGAGDAAGRWQLTHAASHQAWHAAMNALFGTLRRFPVDDRVMPRVAFTDPELAQVGHTEESAAAAGLRFEVVRHELAHHDRAITEGATEGFVKLLVAPRGGRIVGATVVAANAGETIAEVALAMRHKLGLGKILATVHAYPTMTEALRTAAGEWRRRHLSERLLGLAGRWHRWRRG